MVATIINLAPDTTTDASFRLFGKAISDFFTSAGINKTTDTGQIDWTNAIKPAAGASAGYEIRQFTDSLQSTAPIFFKIEYGIPNLNMGFWITLGAGTNGSGFLTGNVSSRFPIINYVGSITTQYPCVLSGSNNRFTFALFIGNTNTFISLERTKNADGTDNSNGAMMTTLNYGNRYNSYFPRSGAVPSTQDLGILQPLGVTSGLDGADVNYYPNFFFRQGTPLNPGITHFGYFLNDVTAGNQALIPVYGVNRNYYFLGNNDPFNRFSRGGGLNNVSIAMLFE